MISKKDCVMGKAQKIFLYKKPEIICSDVSGRYKEYLEMPEPDYIAAYKKDIEDER